MELEIIVLILAAQQKEALTVSTLSLSLWPGLFTHDPRSDFTSDDKSVGAKSETDYTDPNINLPPHSNPDSSHIADGEPADADDDGFGSGAPPSSHCLVADHQDDNNDDNNNNGEVCNTQLQLSVDYPRLASPSYGAVTHQASQLQVNTNILRESTNSVHHDVITQALEGKGLTTRTVMTLALQKSESYPLFPARIQPPMATFPRSGLASPITPNPHGQA
jgi:hypothetical protein